MRNIKILFPIMLITLLFYNCSKDPNSVGEDLLTNSDYLNSYTIDLTSYSSRGYSVNASNNSTTLMLGRFVDGNNYILANTLIQFTMVSVDSVFLNSIISTEIKLQPIYSMPDTVGILSFGIHKMLKSWSDYTFTIDSLSPGSYEPNSIKDYEFNINSKDTLPLKFHIDTKLVKDWLSGTANYGIIFIPKQNSNIVIGFRSSDLYTTDEPELIITYQLPEDTTSKTLILKVRQDATIIGGQTLSFPKSTLIIQGGSLERGIFNFLIDSIPRASSILEAKLVLYVDTTFSRFSPFSQRKLLVQEIISADSIPKLGSFTSDNTISGDSFVLNVQQIIQKWVARKPNFGIAIRAYNEFTEIDRIAVFNSYSSKPPKLQIKYLRLP